MGLYENYQARFGKKGEKKEMVLIIQSDQQLVNSHGRQHPRLLKGPPAVVLSRKPPQGMQKKPKHDQFQKVRACYTVLMSFIVIQCVLFLLCHLNPYMGIYYII